MIGLVRHCHFGSNAYDLGIADQMVWHLSRFESPASTIHGLSNMFSDLGYAVSLTDEQFQTEMARRRQTL